MRLLFCAPSLRKEAGGPATMVPAIAKLLSTRGAEVRYLTADPHPVHWWLRLRNLDFREFDAITNCGIWTVFNHLVARKAILNAVPLVSCPMGMLEPWSLGQKTLKKKMAWLAYQKSDLEKSAVLLATAKMEAVNLRKLGLELPVAIIPCPIKFPEIPENKTIGHRSPRKALFLSRIHPKKGVMELVEAWSRIKPIGWKLVIAGPDCEGYGAAVSNFIRNGSIFGVELCGPAYGQEKSSLFDSADLFVLPTHSENFGLVIPEALAHGLPVITTTGTPWSELSETKSGWWIEPGIESLTATLDQALTLPNRELQIMGENGRKLIKERYADSVVVAQYLNFYHWLAFRENRPEVFLKAII